MKCYVGIDNGLDGGISCVREDGQLLYRQKMPTLPDGKGRVVDVVRLRELMTAESFVIIEEAEKHSPGVMALCSTWFTYGHILSLLKLYQVPYQTVRALKWQKTFWTKPKMPKGKKFNTKAAALSAAKQIWPAENFLATDRSSVPHDGIVDSMLIAEYGRRLNL